MRSTTQVFVVRSILDYPDLNSSPIDDLGNWCHQKLVGAPRKYQAQHGGSMTALQAATNENRHTEGTSVKKLTRPNTNVNQFLRGLGRAGRRNGKIGDQSGHPQSLTEQTNC